MRRNRRWVAVTTVVAALLALPALAAADFTIERFDGSVLNADGTAATQAGAHPFSATTEFTFTTTVDPNGATIPDEQVKDVQVDLPAGFLGNPTATPRCTQQEFDERGECPADTQVGIARPTYTYGPGFARVYNLVPPPGMPAQFAFRAGFLVVHLDARVRSGSDYGITVDVRNIPQILPLTGTALTLWGVPADRRHDRSRGTCIDTDTDGDGDYFNDDECPTEAPVRPFLTNPTHCNGPVTTTLRATSWARPSMVRSAQFLTHLPPPDEATLVGPTGCDRVPFEASLAAAPASTEAGQPSGYTFDLRIEQNDNPAGLAAAALRDVVATLPEGVRVSPPSADGLAGCSPEQVRLDSDTDARCPQEARIGTVTIDTPLLDEPMTGSVYLATPYRNPGQTLLGLYLVARESGVVVKLPGSVDADPSTGRLTARFLTNPQLPFDRLLLRFSGGAHAPLVNPPECGEYVTRTRLVAWSGASAESESRFAIDRSEHGAPCRRLGFSPTFEAGMTSAAAGSAAEFSLTFARGTQDQEFRAVDVRLPEGLLGRIADVPLCPGATAARGACGGESQVGVVRTTAGAGDAPYFLPGSAFLTEAYGGGQFGLAIVVPAVAGPFDLGTVVVRSAIHVDRRDASLRIVSDPLPTILSGIPLQIRSVNVHVNRPGFMLNPTGCEAAQVAGTLSSVAGALANVASRFRVGGCAGLEFTPRMGLKVGARGRTTPGKTTPLEVTLRMGRGEANNRVVQVTLPRTLNSRLAVVNLRNSCSPEQFAAERCPRTIGTATAVTPLLRDPLRGSIYLVQTGRRRGLPNMVVALKGQVDVDLTGRITIDRAQRVRTTFDTVPDVPITSFRLNLVPGRNGAVGVVRNLCTAAGRRATVAQLAFTGQNGRRVSRSQAISVRGCGRASARGRRGSSRRAASRRARSERGSTRARR